MRYCRYITNWWRENAAVQWICIDILAKTKENNYMVRTIVLFRIALASHKSLTPTNIMWIFNKVSGRLNSLTWTKEFPLFKIITTASLYMLGHLIPRLESHPFLHTISCKELLKALPSQQHHPSLLTQWQSLSACSIVSSLFPKDKGMNLGKLTEKEAIYHWKN